MAIKVPETFLRASATVSARTSKITASEAVRRDSMEVKARINMSAEVAGQGLCPECQKPMKPALASGQPVLYCYEHRIAIPTADAVEEQTPDEAPSQGE